MSWFFFSSIIGHVMTCLCFWNPPPSPSCFSCCMICQRCSCVLVKSWIMMKICFFVCMWLIPCCGWMFVICYPGYIMNRKGPLIHHWVFQFIIIRFNATSSQLASTQPVGLSITSNDRSKKTKFDGMLERRVDPSAVAQVVTIGMPANCCSGCCILPPLPAQLSNTYENQTIITYYKHNNNTTHETIPQFYQPTWFVLNYVQHEYD